MPKSLHSTRAALALASLAVLVVSLFTGRALLDELYPRCATSLTTSTLSDGGAPVLEPVFLDTTQPASASAPVAGGDARTFQLRFDARTDARVGYAPVTEYSNARLIMNVARPGAEPCACGSLPIYLSGESPYDLRLYRVRDTTTYVMKGRSAAGGDDARVTFMVSSTPARALQPDRLLTTRPLPTLVVLLAIGALGFALLRSRKAMAYALRMHAWTEARLTPGGLLEGENGGALGTFAPSRGAHVPTGPVLVAPDALSTSGLYRDMPIVTRRDVAEGDHARWATGTALRLRDARALALLATAASAMALAAQIGG